MPHPPNTWTVAKNRPYSPIGSSKIELPTAAGWALKCCQFTRPSAPTSDLPQAKARPKTEELWNRAPPWLLARHKVGGRPIVPASSSRPQGKRPITALHALCLASGRGAASRGCALARNCRFLTFDTLTPKGLPSLTYANTHKIVLVACNLSILIGAE